MPKELTELDTASGCSTFKKLGKYMVILYEDIVGARVKGFQEKVGQIDSPAITKLKQLNYCYANATALYLDSSLT